MSDDFGNVHIVWEDRTNYSGCQSSGEIGDIFYERWNNTIKTWSSTEVISDVSTKNSGSPSIATDNSGNIHIVWEDYTNYTSCGSDIDIFYKLWNSTIKEWSNTTVISTESTGGSYDPSIITDKFENVHIVWYDYTNYASCGSDIDIFYKLRNSTIKEWSNTTVISTESTSHSSAPSITSDISDNIYVTWRDSTNIESCGSDIDISYKLWNSTIKEWSNTTVISTESTDGSYNPSIITDKFENIHIVWYDYTNYASCGSDMDIFYKLWNSTIKEWSNTTVISTESTSNSYYPSITADNFENVHIAWCDDTPFGGSDIDIFYKLWNSTIKTWMNTEVISTESTGESYYPIISHDRKEVLHFTWQDYTNYTGCKSTGESTDIFYKSVINHNPPNVNHPLPITTTKIGIETIDWIINDDTGEGTYRVIINNSIIERDWTSWINESLIQMPIDRTAPGTFQYTIEYYDIYGVYGTNDTVMITIEDIFPTINHPIDFKIEKYHPSTIEWTITDDFGGGTYRIFVDVVPGNWYLWTNNTPIMHIVNTTNIGTFNITLEYHTITGQIDYDTVMVQIIPTRGDVFFNILIYLLAILGIVLGISTYIIARKRIKSKIISIWKEKTHIFSDIINIDLILIIHRETSSTIVQYSFSEQVLEADLISGFLEAMTSFKYELKRGTYKKKTMETTLLDYEQYKVLIKDGRFIRVAMILNEVPSNYLEDSILEFIDQFEAKYSDLLINYTGKITEFQTSIDLINKYFNISLTYPHCTSIKPPLMEMTSFQKVIMKIAKKLEKTQGQFYLLELINYISSEKPDEIKEKIIANIIDLRETGFLKLSNF